MSAEDKKTKKELELRPESTWRRRARKVCALRPHLFIIFVISIIGFAYHFHLSLKNYWDYKTTVSFTQEEPENFEYQYPALTVCLPDPVPHFRLEELFPEYRENVERLRQAMNETGDERLWAENWSKKYTKIKYVTKDNKTEFYQYSGKDLILRYKNKIFTNRTALEILEDFSYGREDDCVIDAPNKVKIGRNKMKNCSRDPYPVIESINSDFRCFTYLSQLDREVSEESKKNYTTSLFSTNGFFEKRTNKVYFVRYQQIKDQLGHAFEGDLRARVMIHAPQEQPVPYFYPYINVHQWNSFHELSFWKMTSHLLESPYETKCLPYKTGPNETHQSFDDCLNRCIADKYREKCKCLPHSQLLFRRDQLKPDDVFCPKLPPVKCEWTNYRLECQQTCNQDCLQEKIFFEKSAEIPYKLFNQTVAGINVRRKAVRDQVYRHSPTTTLIQLISDFGGLGGLWLGYSVITITTFIIQIISKPIEKRYLQDE